MQRRYDEMPRNHFKKLTSTEMSSSTFSRYVDNQEKGKEIDKEENPEVWVRYRATLGE